jgi:hypothetical protein
MFRTGIIIFFLVFSTIEAGVGTKEFKTSAHNSSRKSNSENTVHKFHNYHGFHNFHKKKSKKIRKKSDLSK